MNRFHSPLCGRQWDVAGHCSCSPQVPLQGDRDDLRLTPQLPQEGFVGTLGSIDALKEQFDFAALDLERRELARRLEVGYADLDAKLTRVLALIERQWGIPPTVVNPDIVCDPSIPDPRD
jgi:hypothetical protein